MLIEVVVYDVDVEVCCVVVGVFSFVNDVEVSVYLVLSCVLVDLEW